MHSAKEKLSNVASAAKEHVDIYKAKAEEKAEKATARTKGDKEVAHERRKAKEAEAEMNLHKAKMEHKAEKIHGKQSHHLHDHQPVGTAAPIAGNAVPTYPLGGHAPAHHHKS
ncbi:hypothetical protein U1Q18_021504 [Sarracenia purpurea var. burkii]